jgi:hypothetical protein
MLEKNSFEDGVDLFCSYSPKNISTFETIMTITTDSSSYSYSSPEKSLKDIIKELLIPQNNFRKGIALIKTSFLIYVLSRKLVK